MGRGWQGRNPALGVKKYREKSRDRFLLPDEVSRFFTTLAKEGNITARDFILMALLTGARKGNVLAMRWNEINMEHKIWRIPDTKNGDPHNVPLSPQALDILVKRKKIQQLTERESVYVFPGDGEEGHLADPKKSWYRLLQDHMWIKGGNLKDCDKEIARTLRITVKKWQKIKPRLAEYLLIDKGNITQKRLQDDYRNAITRSEINAKNGKTGGLKSAENRKTLQANAEAQGDLLAPANQRTHGSTRHISEVLKKL